MSKRRKRIDVYLQPLFVIQLWALMKECINNDLVICSNNEANNGIERVCSW